MTRRFTEEVVAGHRSAHGRDGPRPGHGRADDGWIMDTYSMKVGYACPEIVTGKPWSSAAASGGARQQAAASCTAFWRRSKKEYRGGGVDGRCPGVSQRRLRGLSGAARPRRTRRRRERIGLVLFAIRAGWIFPRFSRTSTAANGSSIFLKRSAFRPTSS